jgi:hypothetical protein
MTDNYNPRNYRNRQVRCGDIVFDCSDPRHLGTVRAVVSEAIRVQWKDTGFISDLDRSEIRFIDELPNEIYAWSKR